MHINTHSTGKTPITGYMVYMYPGAPLNTQAIPEPVVRAVQTITSYAKGVTPEAQRLVITGAISGDFSMHIQALSSR